MKWRHLTAAAALTALLAACSTPAPKPPVTPPPPFPTTPQVPPPPQPTVGPVITTPAPLPPPDTWQRLRDSFAMNDCVAPVMRRARSDTRNRKQFERRMKRLSPMIDYIRRVAEENHVAGEFALLPWVESHYRQTPPRRHRPAGMWQIMAITARGMGLSMRSDYDGRLDPVASTEAVMQLLSGYHDTWHDWRLADMAFNTGEYRLRRILKKHGKPPAKPVIPHLPVGRVTRHHLTRLLAIACVIRDPERFHVKLPELEPQRQLEVVTLPAPARLLQVAHVTDMSLKRLRDLNAGYRHARVSSNSPMQLLMPLEAAQTLREAIAAGHMGRGAGRLAASAGPDSTYTVSSGDSLWSIAQRFNVPVDALRSWNDLDDSILHPGQVLQIGPSPSG